jgi:uncharacterized protein with HEPN domain
VKRDDERLRDILEAIERIQRHTEGGRTAFDDDELVQNWILHHLQIIGEAAARISEEFRQRHADVPWKGIVGMRNILVHGYFDIDKDAVWTAVEQDLAPLKERVARALAESEHVGSAEFE